MKNVRLLLYPFYQPAYVPCAACLIMLFMHMPVCAGLSQDRKCGFVQVPPAKYKLTTREYDSQEKLYVPVIFHIVYNGEHQNIPNEQIYSQLKTLNEDYNQLNLNRTETHPDFTGVASSVNVEFFLASDSGIGAITRTATTHGPFYNDDLHFTAAGGRDAHATDRYLNVWVADLTPGIFGYGAAPGTPAFRDGVAIHYTYLGRQDNAAHPYNLGRTLTHEIGHWLGLQHLWGNGGCDSDDGISDTPLQKDPSAGCSTDQVSCGSRDMVQNFMDTAEDACMTLFTNQQAAAMRQVLLNERSAMTVDNKTVTGIDGKGTTGSNNVVVYPNPVTNDKNLRIELSMALSDVKVSLTDLNGNVLREQTFSGRSIHFDIEGLKNGMYLARVSGSKSIDIIKVYLNK